MTGEVGARLAHEALCYTKAHMTRRHASLPLLVPLMAWMLAAGITSPAAAEAPRRSTGITFAADAPPIFLDGRDRWSLLEQRLLNRRLHDQITAPGQGHRLAPGLLTERFTAAADALTGMRVGVTPGGDLPHFHGYFILDTFLALRPFEALEVNFNLLAFNPSASDGYRLSSDLLSGLGLHAAGTLALIDGDPLEGEAVLFDLDTVTLGSGLWVEQLPLEGNAASLRWRGWQLTQVMAGRILWPDDDLYALTLSALDGRISLQYMAWLQEAVTENSQYANLSVNLPWGRWRLAAEYGLKLANVRPEATRFPQAAMARLDWMGRGMAGGRLDLHIGQQVRYYAAGATPRKIPQETTTGPQLPYREQQYVTHPYEYLSIGPYYNQRSYTAMLELRWRFGDYWTLVAQGEYWLRLVSQDGDGPIHVVTLPRADRFPGAFQDVYYRIGADWQIWRGLPHQARIHFSNKQVLSQFFNSAFQVERRFIYDPALMFEVEVRL